MTDSNPLDQQCICRRLPEPVNEDCPVHGDRPSKKWDDIVAAIRQLYPRADHVGCGELALAAADEIEGLRHDLKRFMDIANTEVNESEGLRFALGVIKRGPPTELSNGEVAAWAATVADRALRGVNAVETFESPKHKDEAVSRIEKCVREIEIICDTFNLDANEWLQDEVTQ